MGQFLAPLPTMKIPTDEPVQPQLLLSCADKEDGTLEQIRRVSTELPSSLGQSPPKKESISRTRSSPLPLYALEPSDNQWRDDNEHVL